MNKFLFEELTVSDQDRTLSLLIVIRGERLVKVKSKYVNYLDSLLKIYSGAKLRATEADSSDP